MKNLKTYNNGTVNYGYRLYCKGWEFSIPGGHTLILHCKGLEVAHKVANLISGSMKRCGQIDGLARSNINRMIQPK